MWGLQKQGLLNVMQQEHLGFPAQTLALLQVVSAKYAPQILMIDGTSAQAGISVQSTFCCLFLFFVATVFCLRIINWCVCGHRASVLPAFLALAPVFMMLLPKRFFSSACLQSCVVCVPISFVACTFIIVVILVRIKNVCLCFHKAEIGSCRMQSCFGVAHFYLFNFCSAFWRLRTLLR